VALIAEDGTAKADANSFCTVADATTYLTDRGLTSLSSLPTTAAKEAALINASEFISSAFGWVGVRVTTTQALAWPRARSAANYRVPSGVPSQLKAAVARVAEQIAAGTNMFAAVEAGDLIQSVQAGPVSVTFGANAPGIAATGRASMPWLAELLNGLITSSPDNAATNGFSQLYVSRV
jgi:hypothetical protein